MKVVKLLAIGILMQRAGSQRVRRWWIITGSVVVVLQQGR